MTDDTTVLYTSAPWPGKFWIDLHHNVSFRMTYRNHRGETAERRVEAWRIFFGSTDYHPEPQWILTAWDYDKEVRRDFAMRDILAIHTGIAGRQTETIHVKR